MLALEEILVADDDGLQHMGIGQGRGVAHILIGVAGDFAQHAADDFARGGLGHGLHKLDVFGAGQRADVASHGVAQFLAQLLYRGSR